MKHVLTCCARLYHFGGRAASPNILCIHPFFLRLDEGSSRGNEIKFKNKVWGVGWWTGTTSPSLTQHMCPTNMGYYNNVGNVGASAEAGGTVVVKRESYEGGGSKGKEGLGGSVLKLGHRWVLGLGMGCSQGEQVIIMGWKVRVSH